MGELVELDEAKCRELLAAGVVGRVAVVTPEGPHVVPVNYVVVADAVVFRTSPHSVLGRQAPGTVVAFEVDRIDHDDHRGWSVLAVGPCEEVADVAALEAATPYWNPRPWVSGEHATHLRVPWTRLTGRRIGGGWTYENEVPVRARS